MERGSDDVLIAVTRPVRGREMIATAVPTDVFDSMRLVSAKTTNRNEDLTSDLSKPRKDKVETYYEGYIDGKKYLVPDSNLEAMKDVINLGMRQRKSTRFRHQTSADVEDELTLERIDKMLAKIRDLNLSMSVDENRSSTKSVEPIKSSENSMSMQWSQMTTSTKEDSGSDSISLRSSTMEERSESRSESKKSSLLKEDRFSLREPSLLPTENNLSSEYKSKEQKLVVEKMEDESDDCYLRLVLSGHFKNNEKPIYIIQECNKKSKLFSTQSADFTSSQTQSNVHIFMAGKLFNENILEEIDGKPISLNLKSNKILIDESKCKIFRGYFENTYSRKATDITIKGEFLQNEGSMDITPFLSLTIKHKDKDMDLNGFCYEKESNEKRPSILVKNRQSITNSNTKISKDIKRVSFKDSSEDEEPHVMYKNIKKKNPEKSFATQVNYTKKEGHLQNRLNENLKSTELEQIVPKRKVFLERIFYLITENSLFRKLFTKHNEKKAFK